MVANNYSCKTHKLTTQEKKSLGHCALMYIRIMSVHRVNVDLMVLIKTKSSKSTQEAFYLDDNI